jgi:hypothetical protein
MCAHPLVLPPPATHIARQCPRCGGPVALWGTVRPRLYCRDRRCGWRGPPPVDALLRRQGMAMLPGMEIEEERTEDDQ